MSPKIYLVVSVFLGCASIVATKASRISSNFLISEEVALASEGIKATNQPITTGIPTLEVKSGKTKKSHKKRHKPRKSQGHASRSSHRR